MAAARRATSNATADQLATRKLDPLEEPEDAPTVISRAIKSPNAGRSIQKRLPIGSRRRPKTGKLQELQSMERLLLLVSLIPSPWKQSRRMKS